MTWAIAWTILKAFGGKLLGLLPSVPKEVWIGLIVLAFLAYYANWNAERGRAEVRAEVAAAVAAERLRVEASDRAAIEASDARAAEAERMATLRERELQNVIQSASRMAEAGRECIPGSIADGLRDLR